MRRKTCVLLLAALSSLPCFAQVAPGVVGMVPPMTDAEAASAPKARVLLIHQFRWATLWDYGTHAVPQDAFADQDACEQAAQRLESWNKNRPPENSRYFCRAAETASEQSWGDAMVATRTVMAARVAAAAKTATQN